MKILIDTNVVLDLIQQRQDFYDDAKDVFAAIKNEKIEGFVTVKSLMDIHYVTKHILHDEAKVRTIIQNLLTLVRLMDSSAADASAALNSNINDYEDALMSVTASSNDIDYICTRNIKDYKNSTVTAILPADLLKII